jgi:hypothetical protein
MSIGHDVNDVLSNPIAAGTVPANCMIRKAELHAPFGVAGSTP